MADFINFDVEGLEELERKLLSLSTKTATRVVRGSLRKAGKVVVADARSRVPVDSGALRESIGLIFRKGRGKNFQTMFVGPRIKNRAALALANSRGRKDIAGVFYGHIVEQGSVHVKPSPFLRPALDGNADRVVSIFATELKRAIARVTRNGTA